MFIKMHSTPLARIVIVQTGHVGIVVNTSSIMDFAECAYCEPLQWQQVQDALLDRPWEG